jgi:hypothetical protein
LREPGIADASVKCLAILHKHLRVKGYQLQLLQALNSQDYNLHFHFCVDFQQWLEEEGFAEKLVFSEKGMFHVCGKVNHHNVLIWGTENPRAMMEHVRDLPKVNVLCAKSTDHFSLRSQLLPV